MADKFWISQLLSNLIFNAVNYSNQGKITVSARLDKVDKVDSCLISVKDEGIGIAKEEHVKTVMKTIINNCQ